MVRGCVASPATLVDGSCVEFIDLDAPGAVIGIAVQRRESCSGAGVVAALAVPIRIAIPMIEGGAPSCAPERLANNLANSVPYIGTLRCSPNDDDLVLQRFGCFTGRPLLGPIGIPLALGTGIDRHAVSRRAVTAS